MSSTIHLPLDVIHNVLVNLPVKSLHRFKTVCKSWNAAISELQHQDLFLLSRSESSNEICLVKFENKNLHVEEVLPPVPNVFNNILCSGDGLVLLKTTLDIDEEVCVLWNPSSQKQTMIRYPDWCESHDIFWADYGFCHDQNLGDCKIVIISTKYYSVFSCKKRTWTEKQNFNYNIDTYPDPGLFFDGFTFWFFWDTTNEHDCNHREILYYDCRDDQFKKLHKPKLLQGVDTFSMTRLRGRLCLYDIIQSGMDGRLRVWMMEGHVDLCNWSELMIIENVPWVDKWSFYLIKPICFTEKGEIVVMFLDRIHRAMFYSSSRKTFEKYSGPQELFDRRMIPHVESLFFPIQAEEEA